MGVNCCENERFKHNNKIYSVRDKKKGNPTKQVQKIIIYLLTCDSKTIITKKH